MQRLKQVLCHIAIACARINQPLCIGTDGMQSIALQCTVGIHHVDFGQGVQLVYRPRGVQRMGACRAAVVARLAFNHIT